MREYLSKIGELRRASAISKKKKRDQWWARKYGSGSSAAAGERGSTSGDGEVNDVSDERGGEANMRGAGDARGADDQVVSDSGVDAHASASGACKRNHDDVTEVEHEAGRPEASGEGASKRSRIV